MKGFPLLRTTKEQQQQLKEKKRDAGDKQELSAKTLLYSKILSNNRLNFSCTIVV